MASKDQELSLAARAKKAKGASAKGIDAPLPDAKAKVQQGAAADLQANVGNSGVKDLIDNEAKVEKKPASTLRRDPSTMGRSELAAQAKADAKALAEEQGPKKKANIAAKTSPAQADAKDTVALEKEAAQKKKEAQLERQKAAAAKAKKADPGKAGAGRAAGAVPQAHRPGASTEEKQANAKADGAKAKGKQGKAAAGKGAKATKGSKGGAAASTRKAVQPVDPKAAQAVHADAGAKEKKAQAKDAKADAAKEAASAAKAKDPKTGSIEKGKITAAAGKKKQAVEREGQADDAERKAADAKAASVADKKPVKGSAAKAPSATASATAEKGAAPANKATAAKAHTPAPAAEAKGPKPRGIDPAAKAEAAQQKADAKKAAKVDAKATVERKIDDVQTQKAMAEQVTEVAEDPARKDTAAVEAEALAKTEAATEQELDAKDVEIQKVDEELAVGVEIEELARASDLAGADGERVTLVGIYMPRPAQGGAQMLGHASIVIGGVEVRLGNETRALSEILKLAGETVAITGKLDLRTGGAIDPARLEKPILTDFSSPTQR